MMIIFMLFLFTTTQASPEKCDQWPAGLPTLQECCNIPTIFHFSTTYDCVKDCERLSKQPSSLCVAECYVRKTGILAEGKINKPAIMHSANLDIVVNPWSEIVNASLDKCETAVEEGATVEEQLRTLLTCVRKEASADCIEFKSMRACAKVERFFEDCRRPAAECDAWPQRLTNTTIMSCCNQPKLVSEETNDRCKINCTFAIDSWKCTSECLYRNLGVFGSDGILNQTAVKMALNENSDGKADWSEVIEESVDECLKIYKERYMIANITDPLLLSGLYYCLEWQMSARCIDFNDVGIGFGCYGFRKFKEQCPQVMPNGPY